MLLYRLAGTQFSNDLSGEGARLHGGRWNPKGVPVVYTSESTSLAVLELLVNVPRDLVEADVFHRIIIHVPDDAVIQTVDVTTLPPNWEKFPPPKLLASYGQDWSKIGAALLLKVPSAVVGGSEWNYLINPVHPLAASVTILESAPFSFDQRLFRVK